MQISVIGTGYVGLVSGVCFAEVGHDCVCVDIDESKVRRINAGDPPIHESGLDQMLRRLVGRGLSATSDMRSAVLGSDITFIAVGTPFDGERIDLTYVQTVARQIGSILKDKATYHVIVVKSTVVPGTTEQVVKPLLEEASGKRAGIDFGVGMNPEFLTEGVAIEDFMNPDRIVLGGIDERTINVQREVYSAFANVPIHATNNTTAEMIKYTSNAVLATLISFSNEIGNLCSALGDVDVAHVMRGVHTSRYFSDAVDGHPRRTAPITSFLWAGCGYGGSCLPKDTKALSAHGAMHGAPMQLMNAVIATNQTQPTRMIALLMKHFPVLNGLRITILGLAFKENTDDMRESPAIPLARMLLDQGAIVSGYDPVARATARAAMPPSVELVEDLQSAVLGTHAVMLVTRWDEFLHLPLLLSGIKDPPLLVDGRRFIEPDSVPRYEGIGR